MKKSKKTRNKMSFRHHNIDSIPPHIKGVYGFWCRTNGKCVYVGKAEKQSIKDRLTQHWRNSHNENLRLWIKAFGAFLDICYLSVKDNRIDKMETKLIQIWHPETNISKQRR
ncbi:GIY-YIG nuclease family protein [Candidatus Spongiihabitans sp.]|uniref:GIY-YIG nuclease family protein n=1 Tax=Candidatus Spongiihabitans sp. TaxID=3101308 RepID=UPI003C6FE58D